LSSSSQTLHLAPSAPRRTCTSTRELRLLGAIHTAGAWEQPPDPSLGFPVAECLGLFQHQEGRLDLKLLADDNSERFVRGYLGSGLRLKIKFDEYVRLHRLITGVNERQIWEYLRDGVALEPLFERVPDEFNQWLRATIGGLEERYRAVDTLCRSQFRDLGDRKAPALYFTSECEHPAVLFRMLDNKPYNEVIWKMLRPEASRPFRQEE
jgi:RNA ligase